ncbi:MAG: hypothetical protein NTY15_01445 [Planctomycetota bacterium]|nr:hypothetical protein [Planctomycetota bacterium]
MSLPIRKDRIQGDKTQWLRNLTPKGIANWSFASRKLLCHPPHESSVRLPFDQVDYREEDYTNVCNRILSVDDTWRLREDFTKHFSVPVNG